MKRRRLKASARQYVNSGYSGGGASVEKNVLKKWLPKSYSSKLDLDFNLPLLRDRSSDLAMNSALGAAAINTMLAGVIGSGLELFPNLKTDDLGISSERGRELSRKIKTEFEIWSNSLSCDFYLRNNFYEMQRVIFLEYLTKGDAFALVRRRMPTPENPYTLQLQAINSQRVSNPQTEGGFVNSIEMVRGNNRIINGVEVDKSGRMIAIWVSNRIWNEPLTSETALKWQRVRYFGEVTGVRNILHICFDTRPEMYRGAPLLSPVIETLKQINRYSEAELTSAVIKSFFSVFFTQNASNFSLNEITGDGEKPLDLSEYKLGSGTLNALPRGVGVETVSQNNAQSTFEIFVNSFVKQIGAALNIPYEVLLKQFNASYSASRAALLQAEQTFSQRRAAFVNDFCKPTYEIFLTELVASGRIKLPGYFDDPLKKAAYLNADWRSAKLGNIDSVKEINAAILRINAGLSTREIEAAAIGNDFWQVAKQLQLEREIMGNSIE